MSLTEKEVEYIAHLARLQLDPADTPNYTKKLSEILDLVAQMSELNTDAIQPMAHPMDLKQRLREDIVTETDQHQLFQTLAPKVEAGLYLVPKVIEEG